MTEKISTKYVTNFISITHETLGKLWQILIFRYKSWKRRVVFSLFLLKLLNDIVTTNSTISCPYPTSIRGVENFSTYIRITTFGRSEFIKMENNDSLLLTMISSYIRAWKAIFACPYYLRSNKLKVTLKQRLIDKGEPRPPPNKKE